MEPHPIPQNVTSFEFQLVGNMTLKQFLYLGAGLGTAYLLYATLFFAQPIIAVPLILLSGLLGVAFAFAPIFDRPLDHWVKAFFKAIYSPTKASVKMKYNPKLMVLPEDPFLKNRLQLYLSSMGMSVNLWDKIAPPQPTTPPSPPPIKKEVKPIVQLNTTPKLPTQQELTSLVEMGKQAQILQGKISDTEKLIKQMTTSTKQSETAQTSSNLKILLQQTEELYDKTSHMKQVATPTPPPLVFQQPVLTQPIVAPRVITIAPQTHTETNVVLVTTPNIINGIIRDKTGNFLENVIAIIHDKEGFPVRASKTNKLGQFAGATPLPLGIYTITMEKEGYSFQTLQISLDGSVLGPIQVIAEGGGHLI